MIVKSVFGGERFCEVSYSLTDVFVCTGKNKIFLEQTSPVS